MKQLSNEQKFVGFSLAGFLCLLLVFFLTLSLGAKTIHFSEIKEAFTSYSADNFTHVSIVSIRLPRWLADVIVGASLSIAGAIMQGTTNNPMADAGLMGISSGSTLGVVVLMAFWPQAGRFERMGVSSLGAALVTILIYVMAHLGTTNMTRERLVLSGMTLSIFLSSLTTALVLKQGLSSQMIRYTSGSVANVIWKDLFLALPFFLLSVLAAFGISRLLTAMNLGEEVSIGLGVNTRLARWIATLVVLVLSSVAVIIIGPVGYVGLMVPYAARYMAGTDYRFILPLCAIYGALFVSSLDLVSKLIRPGLEFPIGLLISIIGLPFFLYISSKQGGEWSL